MTIGPSHASRIQAKSAIVIVGSKTRLIRSATVPPVSEKTANWSGSVVSLSNHQPGCSAMSTSVRSDSVGGIVNPLWTSRSLAPATGVSTVRMSALNPAARARRTRSSAGVAVVPQVELEPVVGVRRRGRDVLGRRRAERRQRVRDAHADPRPERPPARPPWCIRRVKPVGAKTSGRADRPAEDRRRGVDLRHVLQDAGDELDPREGVARSPQAGLGLRRSVDVVEHGSGHMAAGHGPEVPDRRGRGEAAFDGREPDRTRAQVRPELGPAGEASAGHGGRGYGGRAASRFVAPQRLGRTDPSRECLEIAGDPPRRPGLDEDVAERRGLDRSGDHRELARIAVSWQRRSLRAPPPTRWTRFDAAAGQARRIADGGREGGGEAVEDAAHEGRARSDGAGWPAAAAPPRSAPACRRAAGMPDRSGRRSDRRPAARAAPASRRSRSAGSPASAHVRMRFLEQPQPHHVAQEADPAVHAALVREVRRAAGVREDRPRRARRRPGPTSRTRCRRSDRRRPERRQRPRRCRASRRWSTGVPSAGRSRRPHRPKRRRAGRPGRDSSENKRRGRPSASMTSHAQVADVRVEQAGRGGVRAFRRGPPVSQVADEVGDEEHRRARPRAEVPGRRRAGRAC